MGWTRSTVYQPAGCHLPSVGQWLRILGEQPLIALNTKIKDLSERYLDALRLRLKSEKRSPGIRQPADRLGAEALARGLDTLALARIHEKALRVLTPANCSAVALRKIRRQSSFFFLEVLTPIENSNRRLKREIVQRKAAESALLKSEQHYLALLKQSRAMELRLRLLSRGILSAQEEERKKISRELHDQIAQMLAGINVHLATFNEAATQGRMGLSRKIRNTQRMVEKSVKVVHRFAHELRPPVLDELGLIAAFQSYLKAFTERTGIRVHLTASAGIDELSNDKRTVLYRVAQAALTNVGQHAEATRVTITVLKTADAVQMNVRDNGKAFDVEQRLYSGKNKRLGVIGMQERVEMVGGTFSIKSAPADGTAISVCIPLRGSRAPFSP